MAKEALVSTNNVSFNFSYYSKEKKNPFWLRKSTCPNLFTPSLSHSLSLANAGFCLAPVYLYYISYACFSISWRVLLSILLHRCMGFKSSLKFDCFHSICDPEKQLLHDTGMKDFPHMDFVNGFLKLSCFKLSFNFEKENSTVQWS